MKTWSDYSSADDEFLDTPAPVVECIRASRLLGSDPYLVLHGGGNISVKDGDTIYVKASGHDMGTITPSGLAPLQRNYLASMLAKESMSDGEMMAGYRVALRDGSFPNPSIETLLHNYLAPNFVLHTHADAIVTLTNTVHGSRLVAEALGDDVGIIDYTFPGFVLAKTVQAAFADPSELEGIVLSNHGLFTMAASAPKAYRKHRDLVTRAGKFIFDHTGVTFADDLLETVADPHSPGARALHRRATAAYGGDFYIHALNSPQVRDFFDHPAFPEIALRGPTTLEHVIRTKRIPALSEDLESYAVDYRAYFDGHQKRSDQSLVMLDPSPRVVLDVELGIVGLGRTAREASIAADVYRHTVRIILAAEALGGYRSVQESAAFDIEYWELEQAKLR